MNKRAKLALVVLPLLGLGIAMGWARWKWDNPTPTARDVSLRQQILKAERVVVINRNLHFARLSAQQRREIVEHLNIIWNGPAPTMTLSTRGGLHFNEDHITIWWGKARGTHIVNAIDLGPDESLDYYRYSDFVGQFLTLHPTTSRFLRQWLKKHPDILNARY